MSRQKLKWYQFIHVGILPSLFEISPFNDIQDTLCLDVLLVTSKLVVLNKATFQQKFQQLPICLLKMKTKKPDWKFESNHSFLNLPSMLKLISFYLNFEKQPRFYHYVARKRRHKKFVEAEIIGIDPSNFWRFFHFDAFLKLRGPSLPLSDFSSELQKIQS